MRYIKRKVKKITHHKLIVAFLGVLILVAIGASGTFGWQSMNQGAFNPARNLPDRTFEITLLKNEIDLAGVATNLPVPGAGFLLFNADTNEQILIDDVSLFITDENGRILFDLPVGNYVIREHSFPQGFGPQIVGGVPITSWYFTIALDETTGYLKLIVDNEIVEDGIVIVFNRRLSGNLEVTKEVRNADGSALTEEQLAQEFEFVVTFSDDGERLFVIYRDNVPQSEGIYISSGESIFLRHQERGVFRGIPAAVEYQITEVVTEGFTVIGSNTQGVIRSDETSYVTFVNTYYGDEPIPRYGNLLISKEVRGEGADLDKAFRFVVIIGEERYEFTLSHNQYRLFENIPVGTPYRVYEYDYSDEGYWVNIVERTGTITETGVTIRFINQFIYPGQEDGYGNIVISKTVINTTEEEVDREQLFDFTLTLSNLPDEEMEIIVNGETYIIDGGSLEYTFEFQLRHDEQFRIEGLPHGIRYHIVEQETPGFIQEIAEEQGIIIGEFTTYVEFYNEMIPDFEPSVYTSIRVSKEIENDDINSPSETSFDFVLYINDEEYTRFELRPGEYHVVEDLEVGAKFEVFEINIPSGYELVSSGISMGTLTEEEIVVNFINRRLLREIPVEKLWELQGLEVELPDYIIIQLLANDVIIETVRLVPDEDDNWKHIFKVPIYDNHGNEIIYSVVEIPISGWLKHLRVVEGVVTITNTAIEPDEPPDETPTDPPVEPPDEDPSKPPDEPPTLRPTPPDAPPAPGRGPQTGDSLDIVLWIILGVLTIVFIIVCLFAKQKNKSKRFNSRR